MTATEAQWDLFLNQLSKTRSVSAAAKAAGVHRGRAYDRRAANASFRKRWAEALQEGAQAPEKGAPEGPAWIPYDRCTDKQRRLIRQLLNEPDREETKAMARAGIKGTDGESRVAFASLRSTAATVLADYSEALVGQLLGHSRRETITRRYIQAQARALAPLIDDLDNWIEQSGNENGNEIRGRMAQSA